MVDDYISKETVATKLEVMENFANQLLKDVEFYVIWELSKQNIFIRVNEEKQRVVNQVVIGNSEDDAKTNLLKPKYQESYQYLREKVYSKLNIV